jgi:hypothetical protein
LVRRAHKDDAVRRHFDRPLLLQRTSTGGIRMNERL